MKILVVCQHYWPEPYYLADACEERVRRGHEVHVVTDVPNYPMGEIYPEYRHGKCRRQIQNGVEITRTFTIGRKQNVLFRFLNYYSYSISSSVYTRKIKEEYDIVFANQTSPVMMVSAAMTYAKKWQKNVVLYCMDLWPASLAAGGIKSTSLIYKYYKRVSEKLYSRANKILISSQMFRTYLEENFQIASEKIQFLPQYANDFYKKNQRFDTKKATIDLMFAGNIGAAQSLNTIISAANMMRSDSRLRWHIVGDGSELKNLKKMVHDLSLEKTVIFYGRKPSEEMPDYYEKADALLISLIKDPSISMTLPGKVQTYMAAGKPIIASADGAIPLTIREAGCGYCAPAEDVKGLVQAVNTFIENNNDWETFGENARYYYEKHFTKKSLMDSIETVLIEQASFSVKESK